jgi:4'-phosphopantetheinyl transferase EntD
MASQLLMHDNQISLPTYLPNGKPVIEKGGISISHSDRLVGLAVGSGSIGLDIQKCVEKIFTVRSKFCSTEELAWAESRVDALRTLTMIWSAKEAIFKYWGEQVDFAREIAISPFACSDVEIDATYRGRHGHKLFRLQHLTMGDCEIVVCSDGLNT